VTISRGNATIFFSPTTVSSPKISVRESASISIITTSGTANTIDFRGEQSSISIENHSLLQVNTVGTTGTPTNTSNNVIALVGNQPSITVKAQGQLTTTSTNAKRGLHLSGENPAVMINDGTLSVQAATREAVNLAGVNPSLDVINSEVNLRTTTGNTMNLVGDEPVYNLNNSDVTMNSSTGGNDKYIWAFTKSNMGERKRFIDKYNGSTFEFVGKYERRESNPIKSD
jgi:hypothetical protein